MINNFKKDQLLKFLKSKKNKFYRADKLAKMFNVETKEMKYFLENEPNYITKIINDSRANYGYKIDVIDATIKRRQFKELVMSKEMQLAIKRCQEDRGCEFHPISIS